MHGLKTDTSRIRRSRRFVRLATIAVCFLPSVVVWVAVFRSLSWVECAVIAGVSAVVIGGFIEYTFLRKRLGPWLARPRRRRFRSPSITQAFEVDCACRGCGAPNVGTAAGEWGEGVAARVFRTCIECGLTEWWDAAQSPPRVRRRERATSLPAHCGDCTYSLAGLTPTVEDRGSGRLVYVLQCPECGRAERWVPPAGKPA